VSAGPVDPAVPPYGTLPPPVLPPPPRSFEEWRETQGLPPLETPESPETFAAPTGWRGQVKKATAPIGAGLAALCKLKAFLFIAKLKFLGVAISMAVSVAAYAWIFGWTFAVGFVLLIFVHEIGHVVVLRMRGIKSGLPVFIPFLGAAVSMKERPKTVYDEALSGIAGPVFGTVASFAVWWAADQRGSSFLLALAYTGFLLNLFNLLPVLPLDGGRTAAALHPALWGVGLVGLGVLTYFRPTPIIPLILILGGYELFNRWKGRNTEDSRRYYAIKPAQRAVIGVAYLGLIAVLVLAMNATYVKQGFR
jgi:Zn-dependent protease